MKLVVLCLALVALVSAQILDPSCASDTVVGVTIDDFTAFDGTDFFRLDARQGATTGTVTSNPITGVSDGPFDFVAATFGPAPNNILGGYRDTIIYIDQSSPVDGSEPAPGQGASANVNTFATGFDGQLQLSTDQGVYATFETQYDGNADAANPEVFNPTGLGGEDLTIGGTADSFTVIIDDTDLDLVLRVEAWGMDGNAYFFELNSGSLQRANVLDFSSFSAMNGGSNPEAAFANLGALRLIVTWVDADLPEIDLVIFRIAIENRFCLRKAAAKNTAVSTADRFALFTTDNPYVSRDCSVVADSLVIGERFTYILQAYIQGADSAVFSLTDTIPSSLTLDPSSVEIFAHGTPSTQLVTEIVSATNNNLFVRFTAVGTNVLSQVTVFYEATVNQAAVREDICIGTVPNRATLAFGDLSVDSLDWNGNLAFDRDTLVCATGMPDLTFTSQTVSAERVDPGETFTVTSVFGNNGAMATIDAAVVNIRMTVSGGASLVDASGFSVDNGAYVGSVGSLNVGETQTTNVDFVVDADFSGEISIECCIFNVLTAANTEFCEKEACRTVTLETGGVPNVKILKRGYMVRKLIYDVDYFNLGPGEAENVRLQENVPAGTEFNAEESAAWTCVNGACSFGPFNLGVNEAGCAPFVVNILDDTAPCTEFVNVASLSADNDDDTSDNTGSVTIVEPGCDF